MGTKLKCHICGKTKVHPDVWGDYDNACEWGCMLGNHRHKYVTLTTCDDKAVLAKFNGEFDEGEGFSMGEPIRWKYPENAEIFLEMGDLMDGDEKVWEWVKEALLYGENVYVCGVGHIDTDEFITDEDMD